MTEEKVGAVGPGSVALVETREGPKAVVGTAVESTFVVEEASVAGAEGSAARSLDPPDGGIELLPSSTATCGRCVCVSATGTKGVVGVWKIESSWYSDERGVGEADGAEPKSKSTCS